MTYDVIKLKNVLEYRKRSKLVGENYSPPSINCLFFDKKEANPPVFMRPNYGTHLGFFEYLSFLDINDISL